MGGPSSGLHLAIDDGEDCTQVNFSQRMQPPPELSLLPDHNYNVGRNSQDFGCRSQERGKVNIRLPLLPSQHFPTLLVTFHRIYFPRRRELQPALRGFLVLCSCSMILCMATFGWTL